MCHPFYSFVYLIWFWSEIFYFLIFGVIFVRLLHLWGSQWPTYCKDSHPMQSMSRLAVEPQKPWRSHFLFHGTDMKHVYRMSSDLFVVKDTTFPGALSYLSPIDRNKLQSHFKLNWETVNTLNVAKRYHFGCFFLLFFFSAYLPCHLFPGPCCYKRKQLQRVCWNVVCISGWQPVSGRSLTAEVLLLMLQVNPTQPHIHVLFHNSASLWT